MLITTVHVLVLQELATSSAEGHSVHTLAEDDLQEHVYRELELQGLVVHEGPRSYQLTYAGQEAFQLLAAMSKEALLPPFDQLKDNWRFLGSDIVAALEAAHQKKGHIGPQTVQPLSARGLTKNTYDTLEKRSFVSLNQYGEAWGDFVRRNQPRLEINGDLANSMHHMTPSYTARLDMRIPAEHIALLEAMDLFTWSVPERITYALTALGRAVYESLRKGAGYVPLDEVLNESILEALALLVEQGASALTSEQLMNLQLLGYVTLEGSVSAAGQAAMRVYTLLHQEIPERAYSFAITDDECELLATTQQLTGPGSPLSTDKQTLRRVFVDRMVNRYRDFVGRYGRIIEEQPARKRQAIEQIEHIKNHDEWFNTFWDLEELLVSLESFDLLHAEAEGAKTVYRLTSNGRRIVEEQGKSPRDITATAVKVLTSAIMRLRAPADAWIEQAWKEGLIDRGITRSGLLYADLAEHSVRMLALTREEAEVLSHVPETESDVLPEAKKERFLLDEEKRCWVFEKLEARGMIERLVDGQMIRTDIGRLLTKAVSGAMHLGHPVTPAIVRLLAAIRQVGTLYVKEQRVRTEPEKRTEVERLTGLGPQEFKETVHIARMGQYIGKATLTEGGLDLLAVQEQLNSTQEHSDTKVKLSKDKQAV